MNDCRWHSTPQFKIDLTEIIIIIIIVVVVVVVVITIVVVVVVVKMETLRRFFKIGAERMWSFLRDTVPSPSTAELKARL